MAPDGVRPGSPADYRPMRHVPGQGAAVSDFDAALHRIEKLLRLNEWRLALLLEGLEELSADMAKAELAWEGARG